MAALIDPENAAESPNIWAGRPLHSRQQSTSRRSLYDTTARYMRQLRSRLPMPVVPIPFIVDRTGLTTTRAVADALSGRLA